MPEQPTCERKPPPDWPGGPCLSPAVFDVLYRLRTERDHRGIRLCAVHLEEMKQLLGRDMIAEWDVRGIAP
jgi:hypothetical protein